MFLNSQELSHSDMLSKYYLLMASGKKKYEGGKKELLWESIQDFYKDSALYPTLRFLGDLGRSFKHSNPMLWSTEAAEYWQE